MPRYTIDTLAAQTSGTVAATRLAEMSEEDLIDRASPQMFVTIPDLAWNSIEPEHESLAGFIRDRLGIDLTVMYRSAPDEWCDDYLANGWTTNNGGTYPTLSVLCDLQGEPDDYEDYRMSNPVVRLRHYGLCKHKHGIDDATTLREQYAALVREQPDQWIINTATNTASGWSYTVNQPSGTSA